MSNSTKDSDHAYDKVTIDGQIHYSYHAVRRDNPAKQFNSTLLKEISDRNDWEVWAIPLLEGIQITFYHEEVWEEAYPNAILPD